MQIQVNTDNQTEGTEKLTQHVQSHIQDKLGRFASRITRAEVHLTDENSSTKTGGNDKRCQLEIRMSGVQPISVSDQGASYDAALRGATNKMQSLIETTIGKLDNR